MNAEFTSNEISFLFEYALQNRQSDAAALALKVADASNTNSYTYLAKAVSNCSLYQFAISNGLAQFARYNRLNTR